MRSRNWPAMIGRVKLKSKIFPASACAGSAIKALLMATRAAGRTKAGSFASLRTSKVVLRDPVFAFLTPAWGHSVAYGIVYHE